MSEPPAVLRRIVGCCAAVVLLLSAAAPASAAAAADPPAITVFAAASLTDAVGDLIAGFQQSSGIHVRTSFAASSALARQIESGAPADVFMSADQEWMDYLQNHGLIQAATRRDVTGNRLVLIAPAASTVVLKIAPGFPMAVALGDGRWSTGDPDSVPVGRYARTALTALGVWDAVAGRLVRADNVRGALAYVARGEAVLGIVYATDARVESGVRVVDVFPADQHPPIRYPLALIRGADPRASRFLNYVRDAGAPVFAKYGFVPLP